MAVLTIAKAGRITQIRALKKATGMDVSQAKKIICSLRWSLDEEVRLIADLPIHREVFEVLEAGLAALGHNVSIDVVKSKIEIDVGFYTVFFGDDRRPEEIEVLRADARLWSRLPGQRILTPMDDRYCSDVRGFADSTAERFARLTGY